MKIASRSSYRKIKRKKVIEADRQTDITIMSCQIKCKLRFKLNAGSSQQQQQQRSRQNKNVRTSAGKMQMLFPWHSAEWQPAPMSVLGPSGELCNFCHLKSLEADEQSRAVLPYIASCVMQCQYNMQQDDGAENNKKKQLLQITVFYEFLIFLLDMQQQ